jgi:DNA-binding HxlR family transcriptional regulator
MNTEKFEEWFGLAQALDRVGDRWTLLIVRELLVGPRRAGELHESLPGLAPDRLADRLREMEANGLIVRRLLDGAGAYELTDAGRGLEWAVVALIRWGGRSLPSYRPPEEFRLERLALALEAAFPENEDDSSLELRVATGGTVVRVATPDGKTIAEVETADAPEDIVDLVVSGDRRLLVALASGYLSVEQAEGRGILVHGAQSERRPFERVIA